MAFWFLITALSSYYPVLLLGKATNSGFCHLSEQRSLEIAPVHYMRKPSVGREEEFSFILKLLPNSYNFCIFFLSHDCTICYPFGDKNIIEMEHTNFNQAAFFFVNWVVKLTAAIEPCPVKISIHMHTLTHTTYSLTNTPGRTSFNTWKLITLLK